MFWCGSDVLFPCSTRCPLSTLNHFSVYYDFFLISNNCKFCSWTDRLVVLCMKVLYWWLIVAVDSGWFFFVIPVGTDNWVENLGLYPQVQKESDFCMFGWLFQKCFVDGCEAVLISGQCWVCPFHHVRAVKLHYLVSVVLDVIHFFQGQCEVFVCY